MQVMPPLLSAALSRPGSTQQRRNNVEERTLAKCELMRSENRVKGRSEAWNLGVNLLSLERISNVFAILC